MPCRAWCRCSRRHANDPGTVTDATGKAIEADKLADRLKEGPAVLLTAPLSDKHRKLFKDDTLFVEPNPTPAPKKDAKSNTTRRPQ